jgi:hypothetical protein
MLLIARLEPSSLFQSVLGIALLSLLLLVLNSSGIPGALTSGASQVATPLGTVALFYNIAYCTSY